MANMGWGRGWQKYKCLYGFGEKICRKETTWKTWAQRTTANILKNKMGCVVKYVYVSWGREDRRALVNNENGKTGST
jgi:hypothetical protein